MGKVRHGVRLQPAYHIGSSFSILTGLGGISSSSICQSLFKFGKHSLHTCKILLTVMTTILPDPHSITDLLDHIVL